MQLFSNRAMTASMKAQVKFWALTSNMFEMVEFIVQWLAAPIAAFVWALHVKIGKHDTSIAVLEAQIASDKLAHDREMKDVKEALRSIASKLDSIELALREK